MSAPLSRENLPENPTPDDILNVFLEYLTATNTEPYDHQEEAILELFVGNNVILNPPTGSGKSLVALSLQFKSLCQGRRSYYTVPIKALAKVDDVIIDEFHYYSDHSRAAAWQIPLLTLPRARFVLFS
jgi:superfamily II RNA helicase